MKILLRGVRLFFFISLVTILNSCKEEKIRGCTDSGALNYTAGANTDDGSCTYERDKFLGTYSGFHKCKSDPDSLSIDISIEKSEDNTNRVRLNGYPAAGSSIYAQVATDVNQLTIPPQLFVVELDSASISGKGSLSGNTVMIEIFRESAAGLDTCNTEVHKVN